MSAADINSVIEQLCNASVDEATVLSFAGRGLKLDTANDAQEIVDAIQSCKSLKVLELKGNTLGVDAAKSLGVALEKKSEFVRALWSDLFTGRLKTEIPDALKYLCGGLMTAKANLVELDLSDNAFGPNGMVGLTDFLRSPSCYTLRELRLNNNGLGIQGGKMLAESLLACHSSSVASGQPLALQVFVSGRGRLENEGAKALAKAFRAMKSLVEVHMPQNGINHEGITALADAFAVNTNLRHINLSDNTFTVRGSQSMANAIPHLKGLEVINFDDCLIRTNGAKALAKGLTKSQSQLKVLRLSGNEINRHGAEAIVEAVGNKGSLEELDLNTNQLGQSGVDSVRKLLKAANKLDKLQSLSDDEGTDDEGNEDDDDIEDGDEDEPEDDQEGDEVVGSGLEIHGQAITIHTTTPTNVTVQDFLTSPTAKGLIQLGDSRDKLLVDHITNNIDDSEKVVPVFMKVLQVASTTDEQTKTVTCHCADAILSHAFKNAEAKSSSSVLCNTLLVHLGLIKSEDKNFHAPALTDSSLYVIQHAVQQPYFPQSVKDTLAYFISYPKTKVVTSSGVWQKLLQTLQS